MPVTFTFYTFAEKKPTNGQLVTYIKGSSKKLHSDIDLLMDKVDYYWDEVDEDGFTGTSCIYSGESEMENHVLEMRIDGWDLPDDTLWIDHEDFMKRIE